MFQLPGAPCLPPCQVFFTPLYFSLVSFLPVVFNASFSHYVLWWFHAYRSLGTSTDWVPHLPAVPSACFHHACLVFSLLSVFILACCFMFPPTCVPMTWRFYASFGFSIPACYSQCPGVLTLAGYLLYLVFPLPSVFIAGISGWFPLYQALLAHQCFCLIFCMVF